MKSTEVSCLFSSAEMASEGFVLLERFVKNATAML